jgi:hypothetical protein
MNFNLGNAIKYIWRAALKGKHLEDLKKAVWYINREIARLEKTNGQKQNNKQQQSVVGGNIVFFCLRIAWDKKFQKSQDN